MIGLVSDKKGVHELSLERKNMNRGLSHRVEGLTKKENGIPLPILSSPLSKVTSKRH